MNIELIKRTPNKNNFGLLSIVNVQKDSPQKQSIDVTNKIKYEEIEISNQSATIQFNVKKAHDVGFKLVGKYLKVEFASKDPTFNKTYDSNSCQLYHFFLHNTSDVVDFGSIAVHTIRAKSFDIQYNF